MLNGYKRGPDRRVRGSLFIEPNFLLVPKQVDWREKGYVTPIKDQVSFNESNASPVTDQLKAISLQSQTS